MRPGTIVWFERLYLGSLALGLANILLARDEMPVIFFSTLALIVLAASLALAVALVLLVSRKGSRVAKWLLVGLFAFGLLTFLPGLTGREEPLDLAWNEWLVWIIQAVATGLLFTPSARDWMRRRRNPAAGRDGLERTFE